VEKVVLERRLHKNEGHALCVIMPTFNSAALALETLRGLVELNQSEAFDLLLIDVAAGDLSYILRFSDNEIKRRLSWIVLSENGGCSAALAIGQKTAMEMGYDYLSLADHDAELLTKGGLGLLREGLAHYDIVHPLPVQKVPSKCGDFTTHRGLSFHYLTMRRKVVEKIGFVDPRYFLYMDDWAYLNHAHRQGCRIGVLAKCSYYHPSQKPRIFENRAMYLTLRNMIFIMTRPSSQIFGFDRIVVLLYLLVYGVMKAVHFFQTRDVSFLSTFRTGVRDGLTNAWSVHLPVNNFKFELSEDERDGVNAVDLGSVRQRFFMRKKYFSTLKNGRKLIYVFRRNTEDKNRDLAHSPNLSGKNLS
jgi:GT2 family glycosyltransferase